MAFHHQRGFPFVCSVYISNGVVVKQFWLMLSILLAEICLCASTVRADVINDINGWSGTGGGNELNATNLSSSSDRSSLRVMTFNIRWQGYDSIGKYHDTDFTRRKLLVLDVLKKFGADVIGLQEVSIEQRAVMAPDLPGFGMFPTPHEAGDECILYRHDRFVLVDSGHEDLRVLPEKAGTGIGVRDFVWVYLQDRFSGKRFYLLNFHTDGRSYKRGRQLDGVLIGKWIARREFDDPVILTGDFNGKPEQPRYLYLTGKSDYLGRYGKIERMPMPMLDSFKVANPHARYSGTANPGFSGRKDGVRIDYVFVPRGTKVIGSKIIYYNVDGAYPSDHFPLLSEFELE